MLAVQIVLQLIWQIGRLLYAPIFWLAVAVVYWQARQRARQKQDFFQLRREPIGMSVLLTVIAGLAGGVLASGLLLLLGVSLEQIGLTYVWIVTLLMLCIRQRFLCFAYSGGLLAICHCLLGWPAMEAEQLLALIAVLHCTEAFLVWTTGHLHALPIYICNDRGQITGGFLLQMVWPLPLVLLSGMMGTMALPQAGFLLMPDWWPVLGQAQQSYNMAVLYLLLPVLAALGYSDLAVSQGIRQKTRQSALLLLGYSSLLLLLVLLTRDSKLLLLPALFAPLGHEAIIQYGKAGQLRGDSRFLAPDRGALILDVQTGSPAAKAGLRSEDWILGLNGQPVENRQAFLRQQYQLPERVSVDYLRRGKRKQCRLRMNGWGQPGIITAPDGQCNVYWQLGKEEGLVKFFYKKWAKRLKKI